MTISENGFYIDQSISKDWHEFEAPDGIYRIRKDRERCWAVYKLALNCFFYWGSIWMDKDRPTIKELHQKSIEELGE